MTMSPGLRRFALTGHVVSSVGWLGAVACVFALGVVGLTSQDLQRVRAVYLVLEPIGWFALVPLALASLVTGLVQALGTPWGLFRHYWVLFKLVMNLGAVVVLLLYMRTLAYLAGVAAATTSSSGEFGVLRTPSVVLHSVLALLLLIVATVLAIYKPRGRTRYGRRRQDRRRSVNSSHEA